MKVQITLNERDIQKVLEEWLSEALEGVAVEKVDCEFTKTEEGVFAFLTAERGKG